MSNKIDDINEIMINSKIYKLVCAWRRSKQDKSRDIRGRLFPFPKNKENKVWSGQEQFLIRLQEIEDHLDHKSKSIKLNKYNNCLICSESKITTKRYIINNYVWDNGLKHYIEKHNIKPNEEFIEKVFNYYIAPDNKINLESRLELKHNNFYLKLDKNQLMILDALMKHGGYTKKYYDSSKKNIFRYSEHAGFFDIRMKILQNIIVQGNTLRVDRGDEEIFLPMNSNDTFKYEYIFHTHPPTPKAGGRAENGILYEFPSIGDIFHFIDHYNDGKTIGSLVMTSEGLYNIRRHHENNNKIEIDEDKFYNQVMKLFAKLQTESIDKYGTNFNTYKFYSIIAQDMSYISKLNKLLKKYDLAIDFYPRIKDNKGVWIVDTIYLPVFKKII